MAYPVINWVAKYSISRWQYAIIKSEQISVNEVMSGVPQASVVRPSLSLHIIMTSVSLLCELCKRMFAVECIILIKLTWENKGDLGKIKHAKTARKQALHLFVLQKTIPLPWHQRSWHCGLRLSVRPGCPEVTLCPVSTFYPSTVRDCGHQMCR